MSEKIILKFFEIFWKIFEKKFDLKKTKSRLFSLVLFVVFVLTTGKLASWRVCAIEKMSNTGTLQISFRKIGLAEFASYKSHHKIFRKIPFAKLTSQNVLCKIGFKKFASQNFVSQN